MVLPTKQTISCLYPAQEGAWYLTTPKYQLTNPHGDDGDPRYPSCAFVTQQASQEHVARHSSVKKQSQIQQEAVPHLTIRQEV